MLARQYWLASCILITIKVFQNYAREICDPNIVVVRDLRSTLNSTSLRGNLNEMIRCKNYVSDEIYVLQNFIIQAAGLATMISTMRPDIDNMDEYVRNTTARAFAVVASALGIPSLLPFLKAVCRSKKSWQARHTGIKIVQQIAILMGCAILPHLKNLVEIIEHGKL